MTIRHLLTPLSVLLIFTSCSKNTSTDLTGNSIRLKTYIEDVQIPFAGHLTDTFAVSYDNNNRITGMVSPNLKFAYAYSDKSFTLDLYENGQPSIHENFFLNNIPYLDSTFQFNNTNDSSTEKYVYNGKLLVHKTTYSYSQMATTVEFTNGYTYDDNGNLIKDIETDGQGNINTISTYTYTTIPINITVNPVYFPPQSKYFPATLKETDGSGNIIANVTYSYLFDNFNRLSKETDMADNGEVAVKTYIYY
jgi:hypothetical protein